MREIADEYMDALAAAQEARHQYKTNGGDNYDPHGSTKQRVSEDYDAAIRRLANATKALIGLAGFMQGGG